MPRMGEQCVTFRVEDGYGGMKLSAYLRHMGVSLTVVRGLKQQARGLEVNGGRARTDHRLEAGDEVRLNLPVAEGFSAVPQRLPLDIVYRSADVLVVNKPAGMPVHPGPGVYSGTLANAVCGLYSSHADGGVFRPVGRLDTGTSGLVLCAGHAAAALALAKHARKVYLALAAGRLPEGEGVIEAPLAAQTGNAVRQQVRADGRPCRTEYVTLATGGGASLLCVRILTGRTHQIRAHFAHIGHPLIGDRLYHGDETMLRRQALHCAWVSFQELQGSRLRLYCQPPWDLQAAAAACGLEGALKRADRVLSGDKTLFRRFFTGWDDSGTEMT